MMHGTEIHGFPGMNNYGVLTALILILVILIIIHLIQNKHKQREQA